MIRLFGGHGGQHRRRWRWRKRRDEHPGWSPKELELITARFVVELEADRARRHAPAGRSQ